MKKFLVLMALFGMVMPALSLNCYYGMLVDSDMDPEEDWVATADSDNTIECEGTSAACVKSRLEYDGDFVSYYYCEDNWAQPDNEAFAVLPNPADDECEEDDDYTTTLLGEDLLAQIGDEDVSSTVCTCSTEYCNSAPKATAAAAAVLMAVAARLF